MALPSASSDWPRAKSSAGATRRLLEQPGRSGKKSSASPVLLCLHFRRAAIAPVHETLTVYTGYLCLYVVKIRIRMAFCGPRSNHGSWVYMYIEASRAVPRRWKSPTRHHPPLPLGAAVIKYEKRRNLARAKYRIEYTSRQVGR